MIIEEEESQISADVSPVGEMMRQFSSDKSKNDSENLAENYELLHDLINSQKKKTKQNDEN